MDEIAEPLRRGASLGRYRLDQRIALGGTAEVWAATEQGGAGRRLALKVMRASFVAEPGFHEMFADEVNLSLRLRHENIVEVFGAEEVDGHYVQLMELLEGDDLRRILAAVDKKAWRVPLAVAVFIGRCLCRALAYAHARKTDRGQPLLLVHRDISPHNVFLTVDGQVKLLDFGIARATERQYRTRGAIVKGKSAYMAPEQVVAGAQLDQRTDMFATGIVLWEMLAQRRLFAATSDVAAMEKILAAEVPRLESVRTDVPTPLADLVHAMLARRPRERPDTMFDVERALQRIIAREFEPADVGAEALGGWVRAVREGARPRGTARLPALERPTEAAEPPPAPSGPGGSDER